VGAAASAVRPQPSAAGREAQGRKRTFARGVVERRLIVFVARVHVGAARQQLSRYLQAPGLCREVQRRLLAGRARCHAQGALRCDHAGCGPGPARERADGASWRVVWACGPLVRKERRDVSS
jgi:hypothetical protein